MRYSIRSFLATNGALLVLGHFFGLTHLGEFILFLITINILFSHFEKIGNYSMLLYQGFVFPVHDRNQALCVIADVIDSPDGPRSDLYLKWYSLTMDFFRMCQSVGIVEGRVMLEATKELKGINARAFGIAPLGPLMVQISEDAIENLTPKQLRAICAHELSHLSQKHSIRSIKGRYIASVSLLTVTTIAALFLKGSFYSNSEYINWTCGITLAAHLFISLMLTSMYRKFEYEADLTSTLIVSIDDVASLFKVLDLMESRHRTFLRTLIMPISNRIGTHPSFKDRILALRKNSL